MALKEYADKRKFEKTPEPEPSRRPEGEGLLFVVHKHAARALHYDLRLELEGVLKSWAVPKGPTLDSTIKRLAIMVEDHPFEYKDFEGVIPENNYGAGSVIIWDRGTYHHPSSRDGKVSGRLLLEGLQKGDMKFVLEGEKLRGEFALVKTKQDGKSWLLLKKKDKDPAHGDILTENRSVVSHKTLEEMIEADSGKRAFRENKVNQIRLHEARETEAPKDAPARPMPHHVQPMLATPAGKPFDHPDWIFEVKWDGYRAVAEIRAGDVSLYSRNNISFAKRFSPILESLQRFSFDAVLDGEVVVVDDEGRPDFQLLQHYQEGKGHLLYAVFDLLYFQGHDLTNLPLLRRKELLKKILPFDHRIRFSDHVAGEGVLFFRVAKEKGLEGIVAKHGQSIYEAGRRSAQWQKIKTRLTQEGVIAGFTEPGGSRKKFGALVLGAYEGDALVPIGQVGSGFAARELTNIGEQLALLIRKESPFSVQPETNSPITWVQPELVCEVSLSEWTEEGSMRHPVFLRMRDDKNAREVVREKGQ